MSARAIVLAGVASVAVIVAAAMAVSSAAMDSGLWAWIITEIHEAQRALHRQLAETLQAVPVDGAAAAWWLVVLSFVYGVLHAAGPGHGKVVIATYLLTQRSRLARGIALSVLASLCQGLVAVLAVTVAVTLLERSLREAQSTTTELELLSYALVAIAGLVLVLSRVWSLVRRARHASAHAHAHAHDHDHECCGHGPSSEQLEAPMSWRSIAGMTLAIGVRPCSGAILVLLVAHALKLYLAGVVAVLAMSLGTAITTSLLAALSVYAREYAVRLSGWLPDTGGGAAIAGEVVGLAGGVLILLVGVSLFQVTWTQPAHPLF